MEYNIKIFFLTIHAQNDPSLKNQNWAYLCINGRKFHTVLFFLYVQVENYQNIMKLRYWPFAFISYEAFLKRSFWKQKIVSLPHFLHGFCRKIFLMWCLLTDQISLHDRLYFLSHWSICVWQLSLTRLWRHNLKLTLSF